MSISSSGKSQAKRRTVDEISTRELPEFVKMILGGRTFFGRSGVPT